MTTIMARDVSRKTTITIAPTDAPGHFEARLDDGRLLVSASRTPLLDASRALVAEGIDPATVLIQRHAASEISSLRGKVGVLARLTVTDSRHGTPVFRPFRTAGGGVVGASPVAYANVMLDT